MIATLFSCIQYEKRGCHFFYVDLYRTVVSAEFFFEIEEKINFSNSYATRVLSHRRMRPSIAWAIKVLRNIKRNISELSLFLGNLEN